MDQEIVKELIQNEFNAKNLEVELKKILDDKYSTQMKQKFKTLKQKLGGVGASDQTADLMLDLLQK